MTSAKFTSIQTRMATVTDLAELATLEFCPTRDIYSLGFEILIDHPSKHSLISSEINIEYDSQCFVNMRLCLQLHKK